jgi:hypothetical protein
LTDGRQVHAVPYANAVLEFSDAEYLDELRQFDSQRFEGLEAIAQAALRTAQLEDGDMLAKAQALERHFLFSGNYRYSLNLDFDRDLQLDPIEDFVVNHRSGHCEYFASALVMMLRSQGIPARMVVGYKGGEFNALGHYYVVRQKHAHAWVEAWLPTDKVPAWEIAGTPHEGGCWYRLDPTPSSLAFLEAASDGSLQDRLTDAFDYFELMWRDYVINLNSFRQQDAVVDPAAANTFGALANWVDSHAAERWLNDLAARLGFRTPGRRTSVVHRVFDWRYAALIAGGLVVAIGLANLAVVVHRRFSRWMGWNAAAPPVVNRAPAFYRRLEHLLGRLRLRRATGQTPREFAQEATKKLADGPDQQVAELPAEIVQTYYRVRFGGATLDNSETAAIEHALEKIAPAVGLASKASPAQKR